MKLLKVSVQKWAHFANHEAPIQSTSNHPIPSHPKALTVLDSVQIQKAYHSLQEWVTGTPPPISLLVRIIPQLGKRTRQPRDYFITFKTSWQKCLSKHTKNLYITIEYTAVIFIQNWWQQAHSHFTASTYSNQQSTSLISPWKRVEDVLDLEGTYKGPKIQIAASAKKQSYWMGHESLKHNQSPACNTNAEEHPIKLVGHDKPQMV